MSPQRTVPVNNPVAFQRIDNCKLPNEPAFDYKSAILGWHITIYRQTNGCEVPADVDFSTAETLTVWQTGLGGLDWIDELVNEGLAVALGGNGYPTKYAGRWEHFNATILNGPPEANKHWRFDTGDILTDQWLGKTTIYHDAVTRCPADEWGVVEAWDES